jgi:hypothetical protein
MLQDEQEWTAAEKLIARFISWGIILSVTIIIVGGIYTLLEFLISYANPSSGKIIQWFLGLDWWYQVLVIGALIIGIILGMIGFSIFLKRGQRFLLNLLFKIKQ